MGETVQCRQSWKMYFKVLLLLLLWFGWGNLSIFLLAINLIVTKFGKKFFAGFCTTFAEDYNKVANPFKIELFKELNDMKPGEKISVLEIGAGPGANFKYYNLEVKDLKIGYGEDLAAAGIDSNSVDAVVVTLVLCSVQDQAKCFSEIKRVLKPGGKFFHMEHILDDVDGTVRIAQQMFTACGFWEFAFDGCCIDRPTAETVELAGFSKVDQKKYDFEISREDVSIRFKIVRTFVKRHV